VYSPHVGGEMLCSTAHGDKIDRSADVAGKEDSTHMRWPDRKLRWFSKTVRLREILGFRETALVAAPGWPFVRASLLCQATLSLLMRFVRQERGELRGQAGTLPPLIGGGARGGEIRTRPHVSAAHEIVAVMRLAATPDLPRRPPWLHAPRGEAPRLCADSVQRVSATSSCAHLRANLPRPGSPRRPSSIQTHGVLRVQSKRNMPARMRAVHVAG
jgi:hypothetical protein